MSILRLATTETTRLPIGDDDHIIVRKDISKRDFNTLLKRLPSGFGDGEVTPGDADDFSTALFLALVVDWSLKGDDGSVVPVTEENYLSLTREASTLIDVAVTQHFNDLTPSAAESKKSEGRSK